MGSALTAKVTNPYYGQIPASSSLGQPTIAQQQLLRAFPRFTNVALFRDNVGDSEYEALQAKLEKRFSRGLDLHLRVYLLQADRRRVHVFFANHLHRADAHHHRRRRRLQPEARARCIERRHPVFSAGWVYEIPRWWKISGWEIGGFVRVQAGDAVPVTQATNNLRLSGTRCSGPTASATRTISPPAALPNGRSAFTAAGQFAIGTSSRNPVRGPGLQDADLMISKTFRVSERVNLEFRAEVFNASNTPPLNDPNGSFGSAAFGTITSAGNPRDFVFAAKIHF